MYIIYSTHYYYYSSNIVYMQYHIRYLMHLTLQYCRQCICTYILARFDDQVSCISGWIMECLQSYFTMISPMYACFTKYVGPSKYSYAHTATHRSIYAYDIYIYILHIMHIIYICTYIIYIYNIILYDYL